MLGEFSTGESVLRAKKHHQFSQLAHYKTYHDNKKHYADISLSHVDKGQVSTGHYVVQVSHHKSRCLQVFRWQNTVLSLGRI